MVSTSTRLEIPNDDTMIVNKLYPVSDIRENFPHIVFAFNTRGLSDELIKIYCAELHINVIITSLYWTTSLKHVHVQDVNQVFTSLILPF